jgi:hypothetical protein
MSAKPEYLFRKMDPARYGDNRQKRPLFIQAYLKEKSQDHRLQDDRCERAHEIIVKWADLESKGALQTQTESNLEAEFLTEVFGDALGYTLFSEGKTQWNLQPKFRLNDQTADAAIGFFEAQRQIAPRAVIELKGPATNVDRDKSNGRTAVQQCRDYLAEVPDCPWGIVSNIVSFRLYHRGQTTRVYQLFTLQDLRRWEAFLQFYCLFERGGLLPAGIEQAARADALLEKSEKRQREVGDELYSDYHDNRVKLIQYLTGPAHAKPLDVAIRMAQKLVDRIIFVAFCEDRDLLPARSLFRAWKEIPPFYQVTNPRWQNFLSLFHNINEGSRSADVPAYNGGLFRKDDVDNLELDDGWTDFFKSIGDYDFGSEVNVDVLGHLFEKSINDIERIRVAGGLWESKGNEGISSKMEKSAERKRGGIYYTPPEFTRFIVEHTVHKVANEKLGAVEEKHGIDLKSPEMHTQDGKLKRCVEEAIAAVRTIRIVDPACGSGAFLIQAYDVLEEHYLDLAQALDQVDPNDAEAIREQMPDFILHDNLFGVDLSPEAVEITQLSLWLRSAKRGKTLMDLSRNIVCGNSLVTDPEVDPRAISWETTFPRVFAREEVGFDCVIGNPPWERFTVKNREFFDAVAPHVLEAPTAAESRRMIAELETQNPALYQRYVEARDSAEKTMTYIRRCGRFPLAGKGDINTYAVFAELAKTIVAPSGRVGLLVPSGIATDNTTKDFFGQLVDNDSLIGLYDFENKASIFPDVHRSSKFCVLLFGGSERKSEKADFVFFAHRMEDLEENNRHISLTRDDFKRLNPNTLTCPIFRSKRDAEITKEIYRRIPVLIDKTRKEGGNPWGIQFSTMFHQSSDAELFHTAAQLKADGFRRDGPSWRKRKQVFLPLYEAKMIQMYDHRAASVLVDESNWMRQGQPDATSLVQHQNPEFFVEPRWWVDDGEVRRVLNGRDGTKLIAFKNVTSPTNERTMIAAFIPYCGVVHSAPLMLTGSDVTARRSTCLLANLNSLVYDFVCRQKIGGINLSYFIIEQNPTFPPDFYQRKCPWSKREKLEKWIADRVLKLTCVSNDMKPLAEAARFKPLVYKWDHSERAELQAELDAAFFLLYGVRREEVEYILSTFNGIRKESEGLLAGGTTINRILACYDRFWKAAAGSSP